MPGRPRLGFPHLFAGKNSAQVDLNVYPGGSSMAIFIIPIVVYNMYILYIYIYINFYMYSVYKYVIQYPYYQIL